MSRLGNLGKQFAVDTIDDFVTKSFGVVDRWACQVII